MRIKAERQSKGLRGNANYFGGEYGRSTRKSRKGKKGREFSLALENSRTRVILAGDSDAAKGARPLREERQRIRVTANKEEQEKEKEKGRRRRAEAWSQSSVGSSYNGCVSRGAFQSLEHAFQYTIRDNLFSLVHPSSICHDFL